MERYFKPIPKEQKEEQVVNTASINVEATVAAVQACHDVVAIAPQKVRATLRLAQVLVSFLFILFSVFSLFCPSSLFFPSLSVIES